MTNKMKLLIGLLALGVVLIGGGTWFFINPMQRVITPVAIQRIKIPEGTPIIVEKLDYLMSFTKRTLCTWVFRRETGSFRRLPGTTA